MSTRRKAKYTHAPCDARFSSARAASSWTRMDGDARRTTSGGTAPAAATVILFSAARAAHSTAHDSAARPRQQRGRARAPFMARFRSAHAARSCTSTTGDSSNATKCFTAPAAAMVTRFSSARAEAACGHRSYRTSPARAPFATARFPRAPADASCTLMAGDTNSATSGGTAPAAAIIRLCSAAPRQ